MGMICSCESELLIELVECQQQLENQQNINKLKETELAETKNNYKRVIAELKEQHQKELADMKKHHQTDITQMKEEHQKEMDKLKLQLNQQQKKQDTINEKQQVHVWSETYSNHMCVWLLQKKIDALFDLVHQLQTRDECGDLSSPDHNQEG